MRNVNKAQAYGEAVFDICYLVLVLSLGSWYLLHATGNPTEELRLYGTMALVLGIGDDFHLIPRVLHQLSQEKTTYTKYLGIGKMITSITMTFFYLLLFYLWRSMYGAELTIPSFLEAFMILLAVVRIFLCFMPQNQWAKNENGGKWPIYRNLPFVLLGLLIVLLYSYSAYTKQDGFFLMPIAITLSFLFYIPVTLYSAKNPKVGMLMLPKTVMYIWIVCMGIQLL